MDIIFGILAICCLVGIMATIVIDEVEPTIKDKQVFTFLTLFVVCSFLALAPYFSVKIEKIDNITTNSYNFYNGDKDVRFSKPVQIKVTTTKYPYAWITWKEYYVEP